MLLEAEGLASEPVNGVGNELFLDILAQLVVQFKALFNLGTDVEVGILLIFLRGRCGWGKEVEERLGGYSFLDNTSLLGVW